jgi:hypothetical protein
VKHASALMKAVVVDQLRLTCKPEHFALLQLLAYHANERYMDLAWPANERLAEILGVSDKTVQRFVAEMIERRSVRRFEIDGSFDLVELRGRERIPTGISVRRFGWKPFTRYPFLTPVRSRLVPQLQGKAIEEYFIERPGDRIDHPLPLDGETQPAAGEDTSAPPGGTVRGGPGDKTVHPRGPELSTKRNKELLQEPPIANVIHEQEKNNPAPERAACSFGDRQKALMRIEVHVEDYIEANGLVDDERAYSSALADITEKCERDDLLAGVFERADVLDVFQRVLDFGRASSRVGYAELKAIASKRAAIEAPTTSDQLRHSVTVSIGPGEWFNQDELDRAVAAAWCLYRVLASPQKQAERSSEPNRQEKQPA